MGTMADRVGISKPIPIASTDASAPGTIDTEPDTKSVLNTLLKINHKVGREEIHAVTIDGITNITA